MVALLGSLFHLVGNGVVGLFGYDLASLWEGAGGALGIDDAWLRLGVYGTLQLLVLYRFRRIVVRAERGVLRARRDLVRRLRPITRRLRPWRVPLGILGSTAITAVLAAFVLQPTVVAWRIDGEAWLDRAANLVDGTASAALVDSVVGLSRRMVSEPVEIEMPVGPEAFLATLDDPEVPLMDRWDAQLWEAAEGDAELFAQTKAILWVESEGRQYAVSSSGCAGLMQFCTSTAQRAPFHGIFGIGRVISCTCRDCGVPRDVQIALETDPTATEVHRGTFPCDLADARFDADRSLAAGVAYVEELSEQVGGNLLLIYVGYNSGPRVARNLYADLGEPDTVTIEDLRPRLANALRPYHGARASRRAEGLLDRHLPKLEAAYARWAE